MTICDLVRRILDWLAGLAKPMPNETVIEIRPKRTLAWGKKVSPEFREKVFRISEDLGVNPDYLMACMAFETGYTFNPAEKNKAGSGATGLIQFMPSTAKSLGTSTEALARMSAVQQLDFVAAYFKPYKGRLKTLSDVYMAILWPAGIGKPEDYVLWDKASRPTTYQQNAGLDVDKDGLIRKSEAAKHVQAALERGMRLENLWSEIERDTLVAAE